MGIVVGYVVPAASTLLPHIYVVNFHLYFSPRYEGVKGLQGMLLMLSLMRAIALDAGRDDVIAAIDTQPVAVSLGVHEAFDADFMYVFVHIENCLVLMQR